MKSCKRKFTIDDNTVSSKGQLPEDKYATFVGNEDAKRRVLIVGNSITRHGVNESIGWLGDWGMAASEREKDYVHLLFDRVSKKEDVLFMVHQLAHWERDVEREDAYLVAKASHDFKPDTVIFRSVPKKTLESAISSLVDYICPKGAKIIFTTCFWKNLVLDNVIRSVAARLGAMVAELNDLGEDDRYMAVGLFAHDGVAHHPGDLGMQVIAERIYNLM